MFNFPITIVIPLYNEEGNILELITELENEIKDKVSAFEIILVDDASSDRTLEKIEKISEKKDFISVLSNANNMGQGASLLKGMKNAKYETIVTMDGDLQIDPKDIEKLLLLKTFKPLDFICSKRKIRADEKFKRHIPSVFGNLIISTIFNTQFTDIGSSLKIINKNHIVDLEPFRNIHRYLSIILAKRGFSYEEVPVSDRYRKSGTSKYNGTKFIRVIFEIFKLRSYIKKYK